jgi:hypothetical protein
MIAVHYTEVRLAVDVLDEERYGPASVIAPELLHAVGHIRWKWGHPSILLGTLDPDPKMRKPANHGDGPWLTGFRDLYYVRSSTPTDCRPGLAGSYFASYNFAGL